ncbi:Uncharacterised protein [uncultured archaeon]|nr:Uncharacterised protein [uncultured archaeon]
MPLISNKKDAVSGLEEIGGQILQLKSKVKNID